MKENVFLAVPYSLIEYENFPISGFKKLLRKIKFFREFFEIKDVLKVVKSKEDRYLVRPAQEVMSLPEDFALPEGTNIHLSNRCWLVLGMPQVRSHLQTLKGFYYIAPIPLLSLKDIDKKPEWTSDTIERFKELGWGDLKLLP